MPQSIPAGLTREHVLRALADVDAGAESGFGEAKDYELLHEGKRYAPKAVIGLACRHLDGRVLRPADFSGGEAPSQANHVLRDLGFTIVPKESGRDWSEEEVDLLVADYFEMLQAEMHATPYSKTTHRTALAPKLRQRSNGSIEFKHQNLSAVLVDLGLPYIRGYKPRGNYQALLATEVAAFLDRHPGLLERLASSPVVSPTDMKALKFNDVSRWVELPPDNIITPMSLDKPWLSRKVRRIDFAERDAANRHLGKLGEQFVLEFERHRLRALGRDDLAQRVVWAAMEIGDGLGFDVISFDEQDDSERLLEVKTTGLGKHFPFYVTGNEVRCSQDVPDQFHLFRVFDFAQNPRLYILNGSLAEQCQLDPVLYRAGIRAN